MNFVTLSRGAAEMTTENVQAVDCAAESEALQATLEVPTGKALPDSGAQLVDTGAWPPLVVGAVHVTVTGCPCLEVPVAFAGQLIERAGGGVGGSGTIGDGSDPQPASASERPAHSPNSLQ
jgi:hypothetical protein